MLLLIRQILARNRKGLKYIIPLNKTGGCSLKEALSQLGLRTVKYPFDETTLTELQSARFRLSILNDYDALVDAPGPAYFAEFDAEYPGSKFILTVRDEADWLACCDRAWNITVPEWIARQRTNVAEPFQKFTDFVWTATYGTLRFHPGRFSSVYQRHYDSVLKHFAHRPNDLLLLNICAGEGWAELCGFLGISEVPAAPFPHQHKD